jgi:hypothetical protein
VNKVDKEPAAKMDLAKRQTALIRSFLDAERAFSQKELALAANLDEKRNTFKAQIQADNAAMLGLNAEVDRTLAATREILKRNSISEIPDKPETVKIKPKPGEALAMLNAAVTRVRSAAAELSKDVEALAGAEYGIQNAKGTAAGLGVVFTVLILVLAYMKGPLAHAGKNAVTLMAISGTYAFGVSVAFAQSRLRASIGSIIIALITFGTWAGAVGVMFPRYGLSSAAQVLGACLLIGITAPAAVFLVAFVYTFLSSKSGTVAFLISIGVLFWAASSVMGVNAVTVGLALLKTLR